MSDSTMQWMLIVALVILTLGTPDILDGLIAMANGCRP